MSRTKANILLGVCLLLIYLLYFNGQNKQILSYSSSFSRVIPSERQLSKLRRVESVCSRYRKYREYTPKTDYLGVFSLEPSTRLLVCRTGKHGSTSLARILVQLYLPNRTDLGKKSPFHRAYQTELKSLESQKINQQEKRRILSQLDWETSEDPDFLAVFVCRHPLERLLSIYKYLVAKGRFVHPVPGFSTFLDQVSQTDHIFGATTRHNSSVSGLTVPMYRKCTPCGIKYSAVIHMETFNQDVEEVLKMIGKNWVEVEQLNKFSNINTMEEIKDIVKVIGEDIKQRIRIKYKPDFEICGYGMNMLQ